MSLNNRIEYSISLIRRAERLALALNPTEGFFVGFSGGKDSQVLLQLVKMAGVRHRAYYSVTTNDPPENVYFIRQFYSDVEFLHPRENFFKLVRKKGLPMMRRRYCCEVLKEGAGAGYVVLTGVRAEESKKRSGYNEVQVYSRRKEHKENSRTRTVEEIEENEHRCIKGKDKLMIFPLLKWTESDVWRFLREQNLPINPCYNQTGRVGCMFCPFSSREQLEYYEAKYPKFKARLLESLGIFLEERGGSCLGNVEEYYEWWKSKESLKTYMSRKTQLIMGFND